MLNMLMRRPVDAPSSAASRLARVPAGRDEQLVDGGLVEVTLVVVERALQLERQHLRIERQFVGLVLRVAVEIAAIAEFEAARHVQHAAAGEHQLREVVAHHQEGHALGVLRQQRGEVALAEFGNVDDVEFAEVPFERRWLIFSMASPREATAKHMLLVAAASSARAGRRRRAWPSSMGKSKASRML